MSYVGIDLSTYNVDLVKLDEDTDRAEWVRVPLVGGNAIDRARSYTVRRPWLPTAFFDDVIVCALEDPAGRGDLRKIARVQGVVIASIPARVQVWTFPPGEWRQLCGLPYRATKAEVFKFAHDTREKFEPMIYDEWIQDACDAYCIAYAARALNEQQEAA